MRVVGRAGVEFSHPLARAAVYGQAPPDARREAHRALASALPDRDADRRAWHLALAAIGTDERAAVRARAGGTHGRAPAAHTPSRRSAFERAATLTARTTRRGALLFAAAEAAWWAGLAERALDAARRGAAHRADREQAGRDRASARAASPPAAGPSWRATRSSCAAAERIAGSDPDLAVDDARRGGRRVLLRRRRPRDGSARPRARRSCCGPGASEQARFLAAITRGMALVVAGEGERGIAAIREAVALAEGSEDLREDPELLPWLVMGPLWLREVGRRGRVLVTAAIEAARARAALGVLPWLLNRVARSHAATDELERARAIEYDEAIAPRARDRPARRARRRRSPGSHGSRRARAARRSAAAHAAEARALCEALGVGLYETWALRALGELELALGRRRGGGRAFERLEERLADLGIADVDLLSRRGARRTRYAEARAAGRTPRRRAPGGAGRRARRASRGRSRAPSAAAGCSPTRTSSALRGGARAARADAGPLRGGLHPASPTARGCGANASAGALARSCARRSTSSSASAREPWSRSPARSWRRPARRRAGATPRRSTT